MVQAVPRQVDSYRQESELRGQDQVPSRSSSDIQKPPR